MTNQVQVNSKPKFSVAIKSDVYQNLINQTLGDPKRSQNFIASISSAVAVNPSLQECTASSIITGALVGEALGLSPSPQLGHYYLVPFNDKKQGKVATFQLGYKAMIQLAIRSGQYRNINVMAVKEGEQYSYDRLSDEFKMISYIENDREREKAKSVGYVAMFELTTGFKKTIFWTKEKMEEHALKYSMGYRAKKGYTFWEKDFDGMAYKTMLRQLISKWGIMSVEMQQAYKFDQAVVTENQEAIYVDNVENDRVNVDEITEQSIQVEAEVIDVEL